jgi:hypothetical protein
MQSEAPPPSTNNEPPRGLPPVEPPSGRFIAQLFLVPGLIIGVILLIVIGTSYLVQSSHNPDSLVKNLDSDNPEVRWRAAHDLAQVLKRPESLALASDPKFALDLAERLDRAVAEVERAEEVMRGEVEKVEQAAREDLKRMEKAAAARGVEVTEKDRDAHWRAFEHHRDALWRKLANPRNHLLYLTACMGDFTIPVGAPVLSELALKDRGAEVKGLTLRRRRAVWALANLGDNFKRRYLGENPRREDKVLTQEQKDAIIAQLKQEAAGTGKRARWARQTLPYLEKGKSSRQFLDRERAGGLVASAWAGPLRALPYLLPPTSQGVDAVLARCAAADDPFLRAQVALALNFWDGPWVEPTLLRLARDDGHGKKVEITEAD